MEKKGKDVAALKNKPELPEYLGSVHIAFIRLDSCRTIGMDVSAIPWTAILTYAREYGITDPDEFDEFTAFITAMDQELSRLRKAKTK